MNTERDYERDYQATLPQGRTAADGCKPRHGRDDRKRERSFSGLSIVASGRFFVVVFFVCFFYLLSAWIATPPHIFQYTGAFIILKEDKLITRTISIGNNSHRGFLRLFVLKLGLLTSHMLQL